MLCWQSEEITLDVVRLFSFVVVLLDLGQCRFGDCDLTQIFLPKLCIDAFGKVSAVQFDTATKHFDAIFQSR